MVVGFANGQKPTNSIFPDVANENYWSKLQASAPALTAMRGIGSKSVVNPKGLPGSR